MRERAWGLGRTIDPRLKLTLCDSAPGSLILNQDVGAIAAIQDVKAGTAKEDIVTVTAQQGIVARATDQDIISFATIFGKDDGAGRQSGSLNHIISGQSTDGQLIDAGIDAKEVHRGGKAHDSDPSCVSDNRGDIVSIGPVNDDGIRLGIARAGFGNGRQVQIDCLDVGPREVVNGNHIGAAPGIELDEFNFVAVHDDAADVTGETQTRAVGREVDVFGNIGAVEKQRVLPRLTFYRIVAVARVPKECIVPLAAESDIDIPAPDHQVIAGAADQEVVAIASVQGEIHLAGRDIGRIDRIDATKAIDDQFILAGFARCDRYRRGESSDFDLTCRGPGRDRDVIVVGSAINDDRICLAVAGVGYRNPGGRCRLFGRQCRSVH